MENNFYPPYDLGNKNVVVTGGAGGIGEKLVLLLLKKGANVVFLDIDEIKGKKLEKKTDGKALFIACDIGKMEQVQSALNRIVHRYRHIHILINAAGLMRVGKFTETEFEDIININLLGTMNMTKQVLPYMLGGDKVLNLLSVFATVVRDNKISYDVSNAGLLMFTKGLALELKTRAISVNAVSFEGANTQMLDAETKKFGKVSEPEIIAERVIAVLENFPNSTGSNFVVD